MKPGVRSLGSLVLIVSFILAITFPQSLSAGSLEDNLKTAGIAMGITAGVALAVVLVVAIVMAVKGDQDVYWTQISVEEPWELSFYGISIPFWEGLTLMEPDSTAEVAAGYRRDYLLMGRSYLDDQGKAPFSLMGSRCSLLTRRTTTSPGPLTAFQ